MNRTRNLAPSPTPDAHLLGALYLLEVAALVAHVAFTAKGSRPVPNFLSSPPGVVFLAAVIALMAATAVMVHRYRTRARHDPRRFAFTVMLNLVPVLLLLASGELAVRLLARSTPRGPAFMNTPLLPRRWSDVVARNEAILARVAGTGSYLVPDERLGWVVGPNRQSADGLKFSSAEGIRSARPGVVFADHPSPHRIALVGDSFTFGLDVSYEESWGHQLERALGPDVQVLNFGVEAYGIDQAYLRYERDVRPWRPDVVILGLIDHDLWRSMAVYFFVSFPSWEYPFAKPRFVADGDRLVLLNVPLPSPQAILAARSIRDLPFVEYDPGYREQDWQWRALDRSFLYRFLVAASGRWWSNPRAAQQRVFDLNGAIVRAFIRQAHAEGSIPLVVYFPSDRDFRARAKDAGWRSLAQTMLRTNDIPHIDLTPCLAALDPAQRFPADGRSHYAPRANAKVAECLRDGIGSSLARRPAQPLPRAPER
jgi:hypothetical protein